MLTVYEFYDSEDKFQIMTLSAETADLYEERTGHKRVTRQVESRVSDADKV